MMDIILIILWVIIAIVAILEIYFLLLRCRSGHYGLEKLRGWGYAHRGLHGNGVPENSMQAFRLALEGGYGIELDVHLMKDGNLAVIHDPSLKRTAGEDVFIEDLTAEDLENYRLEGTDEKIPLFKDVLALYEGKAPMIVELKTERGNQAALCQAVYDILKDYKGVYCVESFHPACVAWFHKNQPDVIRGQLSENFIANPKSKLPFVIKWVMSANLLNFRSVPDFVAYKFSDRKCLGIAVCRNIWKAQGVTWTIKSQEDYDTAVSEGWIPIFEGFKP